MSEFVISSSWLLFYYVNSLLCLVCSWSCLVISISFCSLSNLHGLIICLPGHSPMSVWCLLSFHVNSQVQYLNPVNVSQSRSQCIVVCCFILIESCFMCMIRLCSPGVSSLSYLLPVYILFASPSRHVSFCLPNQ